MTGLLEVRDVEKRYGGLAAVDGVSFMLDAGEILGLIGPNGSGKTTLLSVLAGTQRRTRGTVLIEGTAIDGGPRAAVRSGIARTFQTTRLFPTWTLRTTMRLARRECRRAGGGAGIDDIAIAEMLGLEPMLDRILGSLTGAEQRLAMIASALSTQPKVLLLDEPAVGMDTGEAAALAGAIGRVRAESRVGVVVVDHNMHFLLPLADSIVVMASGRVIATGTPAEVRADEAVIASYLGS